MRLTFIGADHEVTGSCHFLEACGLNILIDTHGWYQQIIPSGDRSGTLFQTFSDYFPGNSYASLRSADGYYSAWAAYTLGYGSDAL